MRSETTDGYLRGGISDLGRENEDGRLNVGLSLGYEPADVKHGSKTELVSCGEYALAGADGYSLNPGVVAIGELIEDPDVLVCV